MKYLFIVFLCIASHTVFASPQHTPPTMPKSFDTLKPLVGTWEGTTVMEGKEQKVTTVYELTSGGTALTEKFMAGTPMEMISVYHKSGKTLAMTHYCAMGNSPHMQLRSSTGTKVTFEMTKPLGIESAKENHMHSVTLSFPNSDTMVQEWTNFENGKKSGLVTVNFTRKK